MNAKIHDVKIKQRYWYKDIKLSEKQIEVGQVKDAKTALIKMKKKYGL